LILEAIGKQLEKLTTGQQQLAAGQQQIQQRLSQQKLTIFDTTPTALGVSTMTALRKLRAVVDFKCDEDGESVLNEHEWKLLDACESEVEVVKFLTPVLFRLRFVNGASDDVCRSVLVNCENIVWLDNLNTPLRPIMRLKPDLFVAPRVCVEEHKGTHRQGSGECFIFGRLADRRLQRDGCVRELYEAKHGTIKHSDFGELVMYHRLIPGECRGCLFNRSEFWLFASFDGHPLRLVKSKWTMPGSASLLCRFFDDDAPPPPPFIPVLRQLLSNLGVRPIAVGSTGTAYLGGGGSGRVFAVEPVSQSETAPHKLMALKVVHADGSQWWINLRSEFEGMRAAAERGAPVVPVVADSLRLVHVSGGGFLFARCGVLFNATSSLSACTAAFEALAALHKCGIFHGDARLPNLLLLDGKAAWIDIAAAMSQGVDSDTLAAYFFSDAKALAQSVLLALGVDAGHLPSTVSCALDNYDFSTMARVRLLATAVWEAAKPFATQPE
jgi:hypothetical protein